MAIDKKTLWSDAGKRGLILGGMSIAYFISAAVLGKQGVPPVVSMILSAMLWIIKFGGCIFLMWVYLRSAAQANGHSRRDTFRYGRAIAVCSALFYSAVYLAWVLFVQPDFFAESFDAAIQLYSGFMTQDSLDAMENMKSSMPTVSFFTNFIWCWLYGTILSAILSGLLCKEDNPFTNEQ